MMTPKHPGIYRVANTVTGVVYIGQSCRVFHRWKYHVSDLRAGRHKNKRLQRAWNKYGEGAFVFEILFLCEERFMDEFERELIAQIPKDRRYNMRPGGDVWRGNKLSEETRSKLRGRKMSAKTRALMSAAHTGKKRPQKQVEKMAAASRKLVLITYPDGRVEAVKGILEAANVVGPHSATIKKAIDGNRRTRTGLRFLLIPKPPKPTVAA